MNHQNRTAHSWLQCLRDGDGTHIWYDRDGRRGYAAPTVNVLTPKALVWHLHKGVFHSGADRLVQLTLIRKHCRYGPAHDTDFLGQRLASGTGQEMFEMLLDYARMLT
jgi:hypothetical protein